MGKDMKETLFQIDLIGQCKLRKNHQPSVGFQRYFLFYAFFAPPIKFDAKVSNLFYTVFYYK